MAVLLKIMKKDDTLQIYFQTEFEATGWNPFPTSEIKEKISKNLKGIEEVVLLCDRLKPFAVNVINGLVELRNFCRDHQMKFYIDWEDPSQFLAKKLRMLLATCKLKDIVQEGSN